MKPNLGEYIPLIVETEQLYLHKYINSFLISQARDKQTRGISSSNTHNTLANATNL